MSRILRHIGPASGCLIASVMSAMPVVAQVGSQEAPKAALPAATACPPAVAEIATCYSERLGSGAYLLAAMPKAWNGNLIVFGHGGPAVVPPTATGSQGDLAKYAFAVKSGYAWIASSYRREGYGVQMAAEDSDQARRFFIERIAKPAHTIYHGASYGGLVGAKLIEAYARNADGSANYDGALFNSGFVVGAPVGHQFRADLRAVYQYYCKNLPGPDEPQYPLWSGVPAQSKMTLKDLETAVDACTGVAHGAAERSETQKQNLANILGVMRFPERMLVRHMQAATFLFREIAERVTHGASAFSNVDVHYSGSGNDAALNRDVARFAADPAAVAALKADGEPTGSLPVPVVSIHSINDPQVVVEVQSAYRDAVNRAGSGDRLVQAFTDENEHTGQSAPELVAALDALMLWIEKGVRPTPQTIAASCEHRRGTFDGKCSYHPEFSPKPYGTRYYSREASR
jgi:GNAT superfamily N-acetyltransferase